ncbi:MAG: hypothetical protein ACE5HY_03410 [Candidatus Hydrothermarchaeales archaeon]
MILKKFPWIGHLTDKLLGEGYRFGVQVVEDGGVIEEWTLIESGRMITGWERGIKNPNFELFGLTLKLVFRNEKRDLERWVAEEEELLKHPISKSLKYMLKLLLGVRFYNEDQD